MKRLRLISILVSISTSNFGQTFNCPDLLQTGQTLSKFIPKDWHIKDSAIGDLNNDKQPDLAVIIEFKDTVTELRDEKISLTARPRIIFVLFKTNSGYKKFLQNNTFILREGEGGMMPDPESTLIINKGVLVLNIQFIRDRAEYKFRFQDNNLVLIGATTGGSNGIDKMEFWDLNFLTKKAKHTVEPIGKGKTNTEWKSIQFDKLKTLSELTFPFKWEIYPSVFI